MAISKIELLKSALQKLLQEAPESKAGLVTWLWPEISYALGRGHGVKAIWERLHANGVEMKYNEFRSYVSRMKKKNPQSEKRRDAMPVPTIPANRTQQPAALSSEEEAAARIRDASVARAREALRKGQGFEWPGTKDVDPKKLF